MIIIIISTKPLITKAIYKCIILVVVVEIILISLLALLLLCCLWHIFYWLGCKLNLFLELKVILIFCSSCWLKQRLIRSISGEHLNIVFFWITISIEVVFHHIESNLQVFFVFNAIIFLVISFFFLEIAK